MEIRFERKGDVPVYLQVASQIVAAIAAGELIEGDALPSVRVLAGNLRLNPQTVAKAYAVLREEGYLIVHGSTGSFVAPPACDANPSVAQREHERMTEELARLVASHKARGGTLEQFLLASTEQLASAYGDPRRPRR